MNLLPKLLICFTIIALSYADEDGMSVKDIAEALISFGEDCDPKPEEEHIIEVVKNVPDAQYTSKCFRHCLMVQFEIIQEGSQVMDKEKTLDMMGSMFSDRKDDLGEIIDECNSKNEAIAEKCENAHAHGMCMLDLMKERGFDIPDLKDE
uniref:Odorant binding protein n=1 Tax=Calliphora stygia TaxID=145453 RepID=A0A068F7Q6_CALSG|nr:odorant binding protein [Calliphora stygia]